MRRAYIGLLSAGLVLDAFGSGCSSKTAPSKAGSGGNAGASAGTSAGVGAVSSAGTNASGGTSTAGGDASVSGGDASVSGGDASVSAGTGGDADNGGSPDPGDSVLMHHKNPSHDGVYVEPALTKSAVAALSKDAAFSATLPDPNDNVFAQPLFIDGGAGGQDLVIVATEANNVYALDAATGTPVWTTNVGTPVPLATLSCGNLDPYGITGTPVVDLRSRLVFFDALVLPPAAGARPRHEIFALSIDTGTVKAGWPVDVEAKALSGSATFNSPYQGQRGALSIVGRTLYVAYGGLFGDCQPPSPAQPYRGWLVAVSVTDPTSVQSWATSAASGGMWAPGGVSSDGSYVYVATGNTEGTNGTVWGGGDAVLRFSTTGALTLNAYFAPKNWFSLDNGDLDLGAGPVPFDLAGSTPGQLAIAFGKDGNAYLLDRTNLGGVGVALGAVGTSNATLHVATNEIISSPVLYSTATATYVALRGNGGICTSGSGDLTALKILPGTPPALQGSWCAPGGSGSPMVTTTDGHAGAIVWNLGADDNAHLHAFDGDTGAKVFDSGDVGVSIPGMRRYNSPIAAKGRVFVAADKLVVAFKP